MIPFKAYFFLLLVFVTGSLAFPTSPTESLTEGEGFEETTTALVPRTSPTGSTISPWYVCVDPGLQSGSAYSTADINRARQEAFQRHLNNDLATSSHGNQYPRQFIYQNNWVNINRLVNTNDLIEYPLVQNGVFGNGDNANQDRVVIDAATGTFAGVFTHRGQPNNQFVPALAHNVNPFPPAAPVNPPLFGNLPWMIGYPAGPEAGGSGGFKAREQPVVVAA